MREGHVYADAHHSIATCGNVILTYSTHTPNPSYLAAWEQAAARLAARNPGGISVITIIDSATPPPDEEGRKIIRDAINRHRRQIAAFAYVVEGRGFTAATMRSVLSLMSLAARYPFPQKVFASMDEASKWTARANATSATSTSMMVAAESMRSEVRLAAAG